MAYVAECWKNHLINLTIQRSDTDRRLYHYASKIGRSKLQHRFMYTENESNQTTFKYYSTDTKYNEPSLTYNVQ